MATKVVADPDTRIITVVEAPVDGLASLDVQVDIYSDLKEDWHATPTLQPLRFPFRTFGDYIAAGKQIGPFIFFDNEEGWRMQPYDVNHELVLEGNLVGEAAVLGLDSDTWLARPGRTILIQDLLSNQALTLETGVSGLLPAEAENIDDLRKAAFNRVHTDPLTGVMTIYDDDDVAVLKSGQIYEDASGTQAYRGQGLERRDKLA